jgi:hypothetical protein
MFMVDVETLGIESTAVVLSAAVIHFNLDDIDDKPEVYFKKLLKKALFVKFDAGEQIKLKRIINSSTLDWWNKQAAIPREMSMRPLPTDLDAVDGIALINDYIESHGGKDTLFWQRGSLDQVMLDSLCRSAGLPHIVDYNVWRDIRTAVELLAKESRGGYCNIHGFDPGAHVVKHNPIHDCAYDILMLLEAGERFPPF